MLKLYYKISLIAIIILSATLTASASGFEFSVDSATGGFLSVLNEILTIAQHPCKNFLKIL